MLSEINISSSIWITLEYLNTNTRGGLILTLVTRSKDSNIISLISRTSVSKYNKLIIISSGSSIDTNLDIIIIKI